MPSGDTSAAALFCFLYCTMVYLPAMYFILPLVVLGRVYYQCHWYGDTVAGILVGTFWGAITFTQFATWAPLARLIAGPDTFIRKY